MDRRFLIIPLVAGTAAGLAASAVRAETHRLHVDHVLGTSLDLAAVGGRADARTAFAAALAEIARLDALLSGWRDDSELSRLNASSSMPVGPDLYAVVSAAESWRAASGGAYDGRLGHVEALWRTAAETGVLPDRDLLARTAAAARVQPIGLDPLTRTVDRPEAARLALDGLAKGYVIDRALAAGREAAPGVRGLMIDIGGDVAAWGQGPANGRWTIGAADPLHPEDNARPGAALALTGRAVAQSGRGLRDHPIAGRRYGPALVPATGWKAESALSATAVAGCAMDADALATALSALLPREGLALAERLPNAEALIVDAGGRRHATSGWAALAADPPARLIRTAASGAPAAAPAWPAGFVVSIDYELPRPEAPPVYSPYVSIWITDASNRLVRQLLLQGNNYNYIDQNFIWWRRFGRGAPQVVDATARPTRPAGRYAAVWDGKDQDGKPVGQGRFTIHLEVTREHGLHTYQTILLDLAAQPVEGKAMEGEELGPTRARYGRRT